MDTYITLLRAVNVGGTGKVAMADLRAMLADLGFADPRTLLQSGNAVFRGTAMGEEAIERMLSDAAERRFGLKTAFFVRSLPAWEEMAARNPFPQQAKDDPAHLLCMTLNHTPGAAAVDAVRKAITGREIVEAGQKCLYLVYPDGIGTSKLTSAVIERALGGPGTARNWNTVLKLSALAHG